MTGTKKRSANSDGLINYLIPLWRDSMSSSVAPLRPRLASSSSSTSTRFPRLPSRFASLHETNSLNHDKGFAGHGRQPGLLHHRIQKSMRVNINPLIKFCGTRTDPAAETGSIGLSADAQLSWFLQRHQDSFIVTHDSYPSTGIHPSGQLYLDQKAPNRLPGFCKNSCQRVPPLSIARGRIAATQLNRRAVSVHVCLE